MSKIRFYLLYGMIGGLLLLMNDIGDSKALFIAWVVVVLNVPFGAWRVRTKRLVFKLIAIHAPIPVIVVLRQMMGIDLSVVYLMVSVPSAVFGQMVGGYLFTPKKTEEAV